MIDQTEIKKRRADEAKRLLESDVMQEAFRIMEKSCYNAIIDSRSNEPEKREDAYYMGRCLNVFKNSLQKIINDGVENFEMPIDVRQLRR